jgi:Predicted amidohydrolase
MEPYNALGVMPAIRAVRARGEIQHNLDHLHHLCRAGHSLHSMDLPVRLIAIPEGALQGFADETFDLDHEDFARTCAIDIPGKETDIIGQWAREMDVYIIAQAKARHPEFQDRFFNVGFIIDPDGNVILQHYKSAPLYPAEHSVCPHDVFDRWVDLYGRTLDAFWPVADTKIGRIGIMMANEGSYPENARALAMNGCEIAYRGAIPHVLASNDMFKIQTAARALDNNMFVIAPNGGTYYASQEDTIPFDGFGGHSYIFNHRGHVVGKQLYGGTPTFVAGTIDIAALRHHRLHSRWTNWMKDLRTELYQIVYEAPVYPANLYAERPPFKHEEYREKVTDQQIKLMKDRGIWRE